MPTYEYQCFGCGHHFEAVQRMADEPLRDCPACGKAEVKRLLSATAFHLKGTGWYKTDYASSSNNASSTHSSTSQGNGKDGSESASSSETKVETPKESTPSSTDTVSD